MLGLPNQQEALVLGGNAARLIRGPDIGYRRLPSSTKRLSGIS
jgi:hypothetical protein